MNNLPEIIKNHIAIANPYRVTRAHGIQMEQTGRLKLTDNSGWKKITCKQEFQYPKIEFKRQTNYFLHSRLEGISDQEAFLITRAFGFKKTNELQSNQLLRSNLLIYLSSLAWMPWSFAADHFILEQLEENFVSIALNTFPEVVGVFQFTNEGRIVSFNADRYRKVDQEYVLNPWKVEYSKYNIKKSYKVPTQAKYFWLDKNEKEEYLTLEKITGFTIL
ncbi:MAG: hypothetical protein CL840_14500 [Crocinitomicaceae bacterium]|nr:hypothetical protein [Crocinitomicaceae bacterium]